jgi:hypothetical protein
VFLADVDDAMNHIYRLCWNRFLGQWVVASELASRSAGSGAYRTRPGLRGVVAIFVAAVPFLWVGLAYAAGGPSGGQIVSLSQMLASAESTVPVQA